MSWEQQTTDVPCFICGTELEEAMAGYSDNQPNDGIMFSTGGNYGSTLFDPMDGSRLMILICDKCVKKRAQANRVLIYQHKRPVVVPGMGQVGYEEVDRPYLVWDGKSDSYRNEPDDCVIEVDELDHLPKTVHLNITPEQIKDDLRERGKL